MATTARIPVTDNDPSASMRGFLADLLRTGAARAVLTPMHRPGRAMPMPELVTDPEHMRYAEPFSPAYPMNAAKLLSRLTMDAEGDGAIAALVRPCEARAFVELVKLNQGATDNLVLIDYDCPGAYSNREYLRAADGVEAHDLTRRFLEGQGVPGGQRSEDPDMATACRMCEHPEADEADLHLGLYGVDAADALLLLSGSARGERVVSALGLSDAPLPTERAAALRELVAERTARRDEIFQETRGKAPDIAALETYLAGCVNCYNCRVACPVCYCRECVFVTDVFDHKPWEYLGRAQREGALRLPTDTVFYHLTRMAHMSAACVGCGQCSNACPNEIPLAELFRLTADGVQRAFDYVAGQDLNAPPPLSVFREDEFPDVTMATS